ncbi:MAG: DUF559 domain-containing protein [Microbacterium sp.]
MRSVEELVTWVHRRGGAAHTADLRAAGFTVHGVRAAIAAGLLLRVRRSWLVSAQCDPVLRRAAELGGRVTCLSGAARMGLWTPDHDLLHLAVAPTASRVGGDDLRLHWSRGPAPVGRHTLEDPLINVLGHVARCASLADAAAVWESAIRQRHVAAEVLARIIWRIEPARVLAATASRLSDSGVETRFVHLMRSIDVTVEQQVVIDGHSIDGRVGRHLLVQLDGFAHHQAADRRRDIRADARLRLRGYTVFRFDYVQVLFRPAEVVALVSAAMAQGLHL